jgi:general stress protein 26
MAATPAAAASAQSHSGMGRTPTRRGPLAADIIGPAEWKARATMSSTRTDQEQLWEIIKDIRFGMLTHRHVDGTLHAHPVTTMNRKIDERWLLYFFIGRDTELGQRLQRDGAVNVSYVDHQKDRYVSVAGRARASDDTDTKHRLFNALTKAWFPGGWQDPNLELLEVRVQHAEYWNTRESKVTQLLKIAAAAASGTKVQMAEKKEVHINH